MVGALAVENVVVRAREDGVIIVDGGRVASTERLV